MRNKFLRLIFALILAVGCGNSDYGSTNSGAAGESFIFNEGTYLTPTINSDGGALTFGFTTNTSWSATTAENWLSIKPASGDATANKFNVIISKNDTDSERNATITIAYGKKSLAIEIRQLAPLCTVYEIAYRTSDGNAITPNTTDGFGSTLIENSYTESYGKLRFDGEVSAIPTEAFKGCTTLTTIILPEEVQSIGAHAFENCVALASIALPEGIRKVEDFTFNNCISLAEVAFADGIQSVGSHAFALCSALTAIELPNSVTEIAEYAFSNCAALNRVALGSSIKSLKDNAFAGCLALNSITLPASLERIGNYTFANCGKLANITIPANIESIGEYAFFDCTALKGVECLATAVPALGFEAFHKYRYDKINKDEETGSRDELSYTPIGCSIYVPADAVEAYKAAENWSDYATYIKSK